MAKIDFDFLRDYIASFCDEYEYPQEAKETFLNAYDAICADKELSDDFFNVVQKYADGKKMILALYLSKAGKKTVCGRIAQKLGISGYTIDFVLSLCWIPFLEKRYEKKGIDKQVFRDGMIDFRCKLWECKRVYDVWGSFVADWFTGWFLMARFAFGRLQYEPIPCLWFSGSLQSEDGSKKFIPYFKKFLNMHIPSMGPLRHEDVVESYKRAYAFFRKRGYGKTVVFHTSSWLLSPDHEKMFDEESNIVRFLRDFRRFNVHDEKNNDDFWRIYNRPYDAEKPDTSGESTMQVGYAKIIGGGGHIKHASGVFAYDGTKFYK